MTVSPHPPPDLLTAFGLGALAAADCDTVERHLSECRTCQEAVASVPDDAVVHKVRAAAPAESESRPPNLAARMVYRGLRPHARGASARYPWVGT